MQPAAPLFTDETQFLRVCDLPKNTQLVCRVRYKPWTQIFLSSLCPFHHACHFWLMQLGWRVEAIGPSPREELSKGCPDIGRCPGHALKKTLVVKCGWSRLFFGHISQFLPAWRMALHKHTQFSCLPKIPHSSVRKSHNLHPWSEGLVIVTEELKPPGSHPLEASTVLTFDFLWLFGPYHFRYSRYHSVQLWTQHLGSLSCLFIYSVPPSPSSRGQEGDLGKLGKTEFTDWGKGSRVPQ